MEEIHARLSDQQSGEFQRRFQIILAVVLLALFFVILRLCYLQIIRGDEFRQKSENNSIRLRKIRPPRGLIMDVNRTVLVENEPSFDILFAPNRVSDIPGVLKKIKSLYEARSLEFSTDLSLAANARSYAPLRLDRNVNREKVAIAETNSLDLPGVFVEVTPIRYYRGGEMISHFVGYTGEVTEQELKTDTYHNYSAGDLLGKYGVERYLDPYLRGKNGAEQIEVNVFGKKVKTLGKIPPAAGYNAVLNIDADLQNTAWQAVEGKTGSVVVLDPRDGAVRALVSSPSFDANLFNGGISFASWEKLANDPAHPMENRAIAGQYPPGSTYKPIIAAAALQEGLITPEKTIICNGFYELGNRVYRCWQKKGHGAVNLHRALVESCDVYFYTIGKMVGVDKIAWYARQFGFGVPTGIDLPREKSGLIPTKEWKLSRTGEPWQLGETISISIGQGFNLVTTLQLARAYAALASGGAVMRPQLIRHVETAEGNIVKEFQPEKINALPVSQKNLDLVNYGLWGVVNENGGTGAALRRPEADVCGKTGTAQVVGLPQNEQARRSKKIAYEHRDHALFVCFAPYKNPEIAVAVIMDNAGHGGSAAAPVARKILDAYFMKKKTGDLKKTE